ncbi:MAG: hypothetical protein IPG80_14390 [Anaerolineales bacterium]|uniref:hypothetical protein n=1 Tax=Candidatus Villigracilis vicinus TaxID=3140679 RepID=UPI003135FC88|nr:hypothetical protein [Anaerolineales bacterium]
MKTSKLWVGFIILALTLQACNLKLVDAGSDPSAPGYELTVTANAALIETALASGAQPPKAQGLSATEDPALPPTEEVVIPAAVLPPAVGDVTVTVSVATNCRQGPGAAFKSIYGMPVGQVAKVVAKNSYSGYWIIEIPGQNGQTCWLWGQYATISGDTASLKDVVTPTSAATQKPTATKTPSASATATTSSSGPQAVTGCTNSAASNYNSAATVDDGSCVFTGQATILGCTDPKATNYKPNANADDGSCTYPVTKPNAPTFKNYICGPVSGPDGDGIYTHYFTFYWNDNSNNEDGFTVTDPEGDINEPANTTEYSDSRSSFSATLEIDIRITAYNTGGSASSSIAKIKCP